MITLGGGTDTSALGRLRSGNVVRGPRRAGSWDQWALFAEREHDTYMLASSRTGSGCQSTLARGEPLGDGDGDFDAMAIWRTHV